LLAKSYWGRGLATEAAEAALRFGFEIAKLERIVAIAKHENIASRRVMEKLGMKYEKDAYYYNNDVVYYSITNERGVSRGDRALAYCRG
jgi:ribosomal-protein-alanine N-acetyltransferase